MDTRRLRIEVVSRLLNVFEGSQQLSLGFLGKIARNRDERPTEVEVYGFREPVLLRARFNQNDRAVTLTLEDPERFVLELYGARVPQIVVRYSANALVNEIEGGEIHRSFLPSPPRPPAALAEEHRDARDAQSDPPQPHDVEAAASSPAYSEPAGTGPPAAASAPAPSGLPTRQIVELKVNDRDVLVVSTGSFQGGIADRIRSLRIDMHVELLLLGQPALRVERRSASARDESQYRISPLGQHTLIFQGVPVAAVQVVLNQRQRVVSIGTID